MAQRIIEFQGRRISVPETATDEQIQQILRSQTDAPPQQQTPVAAATAEAPTVVEAPDEGRPLWEQALRMGGATAGGLNRAAATLAGLPVSALNNAPRLANLLPWEQGVGTLSALLGGPDEAVGGITRNVQMLNDTLPPMEPENVQERVAQRVGEELGYALPTAVAPLLRAGVLAASGARPAQLGVLDRAFVSPYMRAPAQSAAMDATATVGAGVGAQAAIETWGDHPVAEFGGALLGGMLAPLGAGVTQNLRGGIGALRTSSDDLAEQTAGRMLSDAATVERGVSPARLREIADDGTPYSMPASLGQRTGDPGILNLEFSRAGGSGPTAGRFQTLQGEQRDLVEELLSLATPDAPDGWQTALRTALGEAMPTQSPQSIGANVRQGLTDARTTARANERAAWDAIDPDGVIQIDRNAASGAALEAVETLLREYGQTAPPQLQRVVNQLRPPPADVPSDAISLLRESVGGSGEAPTPPMQFTEMNGVISGLEEARAAARASGDSRGAAMLGEAIDNLRGVQRTAVEQQLPDAVSRWEAARGVSRQFNDDFTRGTMGDALAVGTDRAPRVADSDLGSQFLPRDRDAGAAETQEQFRRVAPPEVRAGAGNQLRALGTDEYRQGAVTGTPRAGGQNLEQFMAQRTQTLAANPDAAQRLGALADVAAISADTARDGIRAVLRRSDGGAVVERLMMRTDLNPQARENIKTGLIDLMRPPVSSNNPEGLPTFRQAQQFMRENGSVIRTVFADDPETLANIETLPRALELMERIAAARPRGTSGTGAVNAMSQNVFGMSIPSILSRIYSVESGRASYRFILGEMFGRAILTGRRRFIGPQIDQALDQALMDPEAAARMVERYLDGADDTAIRAIDAVFARNAARAGRAAVGAMNNSADDEDDQ